MFILLTISFIGYALYLCLSRSVNILAAPFFTCCVAIISLYFFGIFGQLPAGLFFFIGVGILLGFYTLTRPLLIRNKLLLIRSSSLESLLYLAFITPFLYCYFAIADDFLFTGWDEFSFWLTSSKLIYLSNSLWLESTPIYFKQYPPAQQLFQYLFLNFAGWSEKNVLYAQSFLVLSGLLYCGTTLISNNVTRLFLFFSFCILVYFFGEFSGLSYILSDSLLGVFFAAALISTIKFNGKIFEFTLVLLFTAVLILEKEIGLILACIVFLAFNFTNFWITTNKKNQKIFYSLVFLFFIFIAFKSWQLYLQHIGLHKTYTESLLAQVLNYDPDRLSKTLSELTRRLINPKYIFFDNDLKWGQYFSILSTSCYLTILCMIVCLIDKKSVYFKSTVILSLSSILGFLIYFSFLLFAYLIFFSEYEGVRLGSLERYISTYMLAWSIIGLALFFRGIELRSKWSAIVLSLSLLLLFAYSSPTHFKKDFQAIKSNPDHIYTRAQIESRVDKLKIYLKPSDKVYFIHQNSTGFHAYIFYYLISPNLTSSFSRCWSLGPKYYEGDIWTCDQNLGDLVKDYNYLVINKADEQFWNANSVLFEKPSSGFLSEGIYKIKKNFNGPSIFQKLD